MTYKLTGDNTQQLTECTSFAEDPSLRSCKHIQHFIIAYNSSSWQSNPFVLPRQLGGHMYAYTQKHKDTYFLKTKIHF